MAGKFLSLEEAARRLGVSLDEVNRLVDRKELFPMRDGATIKFKVDEIERVAANLGAGSAAGNDDLSLDLSSPGMGGSLLGAGSDAELSLDEPLDQESIFAGDADGEAVMGSQTVVRGGGAPVLGSGTFDVDDLALDSIVSASSPSLGGEVPPAAIDSGTLAIDLSNLGGGSLAGGSVPGLSTASGPGGSLAGAIDSGLSLEGGGLDISGIDLDTIGAAAAPGSAVESLGGSLAGEAFELGAEVADEESASVVISTEESADSSFFGAAMDDSASVSFGDGSGADAMAVGVGVGSDFEPISAAPPFSVWQVVGLICCTLLLFVCGLVVFDVLTTVRGPQGRPLASPLLSALAETFGW